LSVRGKYTGKYFEISRFPAQGRLSKKGGWHPPEAGNQPSSGLKKVGAMKSTITIIAAAMLLAITIVGCTKDSVKPSTAAGTSNYHLNTRPATGNDSSGNQNPPVPPH
jgi:hypothetical protein